MKDGRYNFDAVGYAFLTAETTDLKPHEFAALMTIAGHFNAEKNGAFPSVERMVQITGISKASMHRAINGLAEKGIVKVEKEKGEGKQYTHNVYRLPGYAPKRRAAGRPATTPQSGTFDYTVAPIAQPGQTQVAGYFT